MEKSMKSEGAGKRAEIGSKDASGHMDSHREPEIPNVATEFLAFKVAEEAKKQLISWAKWLIGAVTFFIAILGVKTFLDVQNKINSAIDTQLMRANLATSNLIERFKVQKESELGRFRLETKTAIQEIKTKKEETSKLLDQYGGAVPPYLTKTNIASITRRIYDAQKEKKLPGKLIRSEGAPPIGDKVANDVYDNIGITARFFNEVFGCKITTNAANEINATVHYGLDYDNAFWSGEQLVIGDGDETVFRVFSGLDLVAVELGNPLLDQYVTLRFQGESGSIQVHLRDLFSSLVIQWYKKQRVDQADWLIGSNLLASKVQGRAIRSLKEPGTAYDDPALGKDPQPAHMTNYVTTSQDSGGVHINGGIPNRAFYLVAIEIGGYAWEKAGKIWFGSLDRLNDNVDFKTFAKTTLEVARSLYGDTSAEAKAVMKGWAGVGIHL